MHFDFCFTLCFTGNLPFKPWLVMVVFFPYFLMTVWILSGSRSSTDYTSIEWPMCSWVTDVQRVEDANSTRSLTCMRRKTASLSHDLSILTVCGFFFFFSFFTFEHHFKIYCYPFNNIYLNYRNLFLVF